MRIVARAGARARVAPASRATSRRRLADHRRHARLEDARLLARDLLERGAEVLGVIEPDRRHARRRAACTHVGRVESSAEARLDRRATSAPRAAKYSNAIAVVASKNDAPSRSTAGDPSLDEVDDLAARRSARRRRRCARENRRGAATCSARRAAPSRASSASAVATRASLPVRAGDVQRRDTARCGSPSSASSARVRSRPNLKAPVVRANR